MGETIEWDSKKHLQEESQIKGWQGKRSPTGEVSGWVGNYGIIETEEIEWFKLSGQHC